MSHSRGGRIVALAIVLTTTQLALAGSAGAVTAPPVWKCRASVGYTTLGGGDRAETIVANGNINSARGRDPDRPLCGTGEAGAGNAPRQLSIPPDLLAARSASAITQLAPEFGDAVDQRVTAIGRVENLTLQLPQGGSVLLGVVAADSTATANCPGVGAAPVLAGTSKVSGLTLGGDALSADGLLAELTRRLAPLNPLVKVIVNEQIRTPDSLTVRALHVVVLEGGVGGRPVVDAVVAETKVGFNGAVCSPGVIPPICPKGSDYVAQRGLCVILASPGSGFGDIVVGRPFEGPAGGTVVPIDLARKRFGSSPCLTGSGPKYAVVGTKRANKITGTNRRDRILGLGGSDTLDGGGAADCLDGGTGNDRLSGGVGSDRAYGLAGRDHLNGGSGNDRLDGGRGNDTINAAFGTDRTIGGSGNDAINITTAGRPASASCGSGRDKARVNRNERRRVKGCETVHVLKD